jgi:hypothetical protein
MLSRRAALMTAAAVVGLAVWYFWPGEAASIRGRLDALAEDLNASATTGVGVAAHASRIGTYFTDDVVIDLGQGAVPIEGRNTVVGMLVRLDPRTAQFSIRFEDASVHLRSASNADVNLTAEIMRRGTNARDTSMDAREFAVAFRKVGDEWLIARVHAVDTIR